MIMSSMLFFKCFLQVIYSVGAGCHACGTIFDLILCMVTSDYTFGEFLTCSYVPRRLFSLYWSCKLALTQLHRCLLFIYTGLPRYPAPYPLMVRPPFPQRPPGSVGVLPRPLVPGIPGVRPIVPPVVRPAVVPTVTPAEKPQTTVYVGKIAPTADNDFMLSLLKVDCWASNIYMLLLLKGLLN